MAAFGAKYIKFAAIKGEEKNALPTYTKPVELGGLVKADLSLSLASAEQYADDRLSESLEEFISGTLAVEVADMTEKISSAVYGSNFNEAQELADNTADNAPTGGIAYYKTLLRNGKKCYEGVYYPKVRAQQVSDSAQTKGSSASFQNTPVTFKIMEALNGDWRIRKEFEDENEAITFVDKKLAESEV